MENVSDKEKLDYVEKLGTYRKHNQEVLCFEEALRLRMWMEAEPCRETNYEG